MEKYQHFLGNSYFLLEISKKVHFIENLLTFFVRLGCVRFQAFSYRHLRREGVHVWSRGERGAWGWRELTEEAPTTSHGS